MKKLRTTRERSRMMSLIRSSGNRSTELKLSGLFRKNGITGWRRNNRAIIGKPDFIFRPNKIAVFVDGCFWHGCNEIKNSPKRNREFWSNKIVRNKLRDRSVNRILSRRGWKVVRIWEHDLKKREMHAVAKVSKALLLRP